MNSARPIFRLLLIGLLLLQLPLGNGAFANNPGLSHDSSSMAMDETMGHPCHGGASIEADCEDLGCVFCGLANIAGSSTAHTYLAYLLFVMDATIPATPRFEQPVELRPPKNARYV